MKRSPLKAKKPLRRKSNKPTKTLRARAVKAFNDWIKARDKYKCVTCGKQMQKGDINCNAGHFIHGNSVDFDERNMNCQCGRPCNKDLHGNAVPYTIFMMNKYGMETIHELYRLKRIPRKFAKQELEEIINKYKGE